MLNLDEIIKEKGRKNCYISEITVFELRFGAENSRHHIKSWISLFKDYQLLQSTTVQNGMRKRK